MIICSNDDVCISADNYNPTLESVAGRYCDMRLKQEFRMKSLSQM